MALFTREEITQSLEQMGRMAATRGLSLNLVLLGGATMVLAYDARKSTRDVDAFFVPPPEAGVVRELARAVAAENGWPDDWLNDAAKGYLKGIKTGPIVHQSPGITVRQAAPEQLLAMKLCAWRDDVDIEDAALLLAVLARDSGRDEIWERVRPFLVPGQELKAQYAFADLWESRHGNP